MNSEITIRLFRLQSGIKRLCTGPGYMWIFEDIPSIASAENKSTAKEQVRAICNGRMCPAWEPVLVQMERALEAKGYEPLGQDVK